MGDIFLKLLNMSITAGWLILVVLGIRLLFRKIPKWVTCLLWGVVAIRLIFPFSIESEFSLQPGAEPVRSNTMVEGQVVPYVPSIDSNLQIVDNVVNPLLAETFAYQEAESVAPLQVLTAVSESIWLCGMAGLLIFALVSMIKLRLSVREAVLYKENIYICDAVKSPFILGIVKPKIYLSSALSEEEMNYIIAHERAHLNRKDHLWKPFGYLLLCIYWFNPLCWIAYIMLCKDIELACDEKVIKNMSIGDKKEYSGVLLSCASQRRPVSVCPLAFGEVEVKERVKSVLNYKKPAFWVTIPAIIVCIIVAICFLTNPHKEYSIRITIPAGSTEEIAYQEDFCYSDEEISPTGHQIILSLGEGAGDAEIVLKPIEVKEENAYEPTYITPGMPVKMDVEKGAWFKIGVNMQNPTTEDIDVYVSVRNVEVRIASEECGDLSELAGTDDNQESGPAYQKEAEENTENPIAESTMADTSIVSGIVVTNGNTGEEITLSADSAAYKELLKLYRQLDFTVEYEENTRVGYQYKMKLLDTDGNQLQSVTPYKDGVTVDGIFFKYDNTGKDAVPSLSLMEYLEYLCSSEQASTEKTIMEIPVNTLENVTMIMEKYKSYEGDIEIVNQSGDELITGEWYAIYRYEDGEWHRLDELIDGIWKEVAYSIPNGQTTVFPTNWKTWYGELPPGEYCIVKKVYLHLEDGVDMYYLATEFEIG